MKMNLNPNGQVRVFAKDGAFIDVWPVDARALVKRGEYSFDDPTADSGAGGANVDVEAVTAEIEAAETIETLRTIAEGAGLSVHPRASDVDKAKASLLEQLG